MCIGISDKKQTLKNQDTGGPDGGCSPVPGEQILTDQGLDGEEEKGRTENRKCVEEHAQNLTVKTEIDAL